MRYQIRHGCGPTSLLMGKATSLEDAKAKRVVSGDLVFLDGKVCSDPSWLWDWEKADPDSYAKRCLERETR